MHFRPDGGFYPLPLVGDKLVFGLSENSGWESLLSLWHPSLQKISLAEGVAVSKVWGPKGGGRA